MNIVTVTGRNNESLQNIILRGAQNLIYWSVSGTTIQNNTSDIIVDVRGTEIIGGNSSRMAENSSISAGLKIKSSLLSYVTNVQVAAVLIQETPTALAILINVGFLVKSVTATDSDFNCGFFISSVEPVVTTTHDPILWVAIGSDLSTNYGILFEDTWYQDTAALQLSVDGEQCLVGDLSCGDLIRYAREKDTLYTSPLSIHINLDASTNNGQLKLIGFGRNILQSYTEITVSGFKQAVNGIEYLGLHTKTSLNTSNILFFN